MKTGIAVLLVLIGASLALALVLTGGHALITWVSMLEPETRGPESGVILTHLVQQLPATVLLSLVAAALLALFRLLRERVSPMTPLILLWITLSLLLYGGLTLTLHLERNGAPVASVAQAPPHGRLLRLSHAAVYIGERTDERLQRVLVWRQSEGADGPRFVLYPEARYDAASESILFPGDGEPLSLREMRDGPWPAQQAPAALASLMRDVQWISGRLRADLVPPPVGGVLVGLLTVVSLSFAVIMSWSLVRLTRWPLFNAIVAVCWLRLLLFLAALPSDPSITELVSDVKLVGEAFGGLGTVTEYLYPAALALTGLLLLGLSIVLPSFAQWKRETHGE